MIFESHFESGNLQLAYITQTLEEQKSSININNMNKMIENNKNNLNNSDTNNIINSIINSNTNNSTDNNTIDCIKKEETEMYELFLHNDTNTSGYTQWFFFRVSNTKKGKTVNLNIMNLLRKKTKYSNGIKVWCYSRKNSEINKIGWHHTTENVNYYKNFLYKINKGKKEYYYTLSFNYTFQFDNDEVFFANCIPFTYTDLTRDLNTFTKKENDKYIFFDRRKLCSTIVGNDVEYFTINSTSIYPLVKNNSSINKPKNGVVLFGRQHPSETVGSWTIKGAIDFLMGESDEAKYLRDNFIFKIIPMINVDGVVCGNTRTSLSGCDLNRRWSNPNILLHPEIFYAKELINDFCKRNNIECIVDFHGHFGAFNSFFYANHKEDNFSSCKFFPFTCAKKSKVIQFEKSIFKMPKYKKATGRINLFKELNVENVVTLETSYFGCNSGGYTNQYFNVETLQEIGRDICNGILLFHYPNLKLGIDNNLNNYPLLLNKVENDEKIINSEFTEYINKIKNEKSDENNSEEDKNKSKNENKKENEKDEENNDDNDKDDYLNDEVSDSESDPSGDNLEESEILKLLPPIKKLKKIRKRNKNKKINKRNFIGLNTNNNSNNLKFNINGIFTQNNNNGINQLNILSSLLGKENQNKKNAIKDKNCNSIDVNVKSKKDIINSEEDAFTINKNNSNNLSKIQKDMSTKSFLVKINAGPPITSINKNKQNININVSISLNKSINITLVDKYTQTEEIFFKYSWKNFIGMYKIITPQIKKYPLLCQLKPIKLNSIKNSYSFTNKKDFFYNNSIIPPSQTIDLRHSKQFPQNNALNMMKFNLNNDKSNKGNRNTSMLPFGPLINNNNYNIMEKTGTMNTIRYRNLSNQDRLKELNIKNQKLIKYPVVQFKNICFKNISDKKEN